MSVNALIFTEIMDDGYSFGRALGAYRIATELRKAGYTCQVIDFYTQFSQEELDAIVAKYVGQDTLLVGFSSTFFMYKDDVLGGFQKAQLSPETKSLMVSTRTLSYQSLGTTHLPYHYTKMQPWFASIRAINPKLRIVVGGAKAQYLTGPCDAFIIGYADQAIVEYIKYIDGKNPFFQFERLPWEQIAIYGDQYKDKFEYTTSTVEWHPSDHIQQGEVVPIEIARGCIFKCKFCAYPLNGKSKLDYIKTESTLRDEFLKNYNEYGITKYVYADDTHNDSVEKLEMLHSVVTNLPFKLEYAAYLRHDLIYAHKHTATLLKESGLRTAIFGIETLNYDAAKAIGKGLHPDKIKELLYWLKEDIWKNEISTTSGFIVGLPHDTRETVKKWADWILDLECPLDSFAIQPLFISKSDKKSRIWKSDFETNSEKYGYTVSENGNWSNDNFTRSEASVLAQELTDRAIATNRHRNAGFSLLMLANLGFDINAINGLNRSSTIGREQFAAGRHKFINIYKQNILSDIQFKGTMVPLDYKPRDFY